MSATPSDRPTDSEVCYLSGRINIPHSMSDIFVDTVLCDVERYILYPHISEANVQHFHFAFAVSGDTKKCADKYRKRCGNFIRSRGLPAGKMSKRINIMYNGISNFVSYVKHENAEPILRGYERSWFDAIEAKVKETPVGIGAHFVKPVKKAAKPDHFWTITHQNMIKIALRYRKNEGLTTTDLSVVLSHMLNAGGWMFSDSVLRRGICSEMWYIFDKMCRGEQIYPEGRINRMMVSTAWEGCM